MTASRSSGSMDIDLVASAWSARCRAGQHGDRPAGRQGGDRGPPSGRPRGDLPGVPRGRRAGGGGDRTAVIGSRSLLFQEAWDYDHPAAPSPTPSLFDEGLAYGRALTHLNDRRKRVGIYAGLGCVDAGPALAAVAEVLQAPVATSVSGKGCIPDAHPLAVGWGYGKQGTRAAEAAFKDVDLVLAIGVRYSEVSTANYAILQLRHADPMSTSTPRTWAGTCRRTSASMPMPGYSSTGSSPTAKPSGDPPAPGSGRISRNGGRSIVARP